MGLFIAQEEGELSDVSGYSMAVAGAEFNVAVGLARLNMPVTYLTRLGEDPFGQKIVRTLQRNGIGSEFVSFSKERSTGFMLKSKVSTGIRRSSSAKVRRRLPSPKRMWIGWIFPATVLCT